MDEPKRLAPLSEVARTLYLASGNRCAFPGCDKPLMRSDGVLVGEIAHIEGALRGSARFRDDMTNEERRAYGNLMLMCAHCHTIVDADEETWTVQKLKELKSRHEAIYMGAVDQLRRQVGDLTQGTTWKPARNLKRVLPLDQSEEDLSWNLEVADSFAARLASLPIGARSLLAIIINRGRTTGGWGTGWDSEVSIPVSLLRQIADCTPNELVDHLTILNHAELLHTDWEPFDSPPVHEVGNSTPGVGWRLIEDLCATGDAKLVRQVIVDLDFSVLDT